MDLHNFLMLQDFYRENDMWDTKAPVEKVTHYIKQRLLSCELRPGDRIPTEDELRQTLEVSRTSVREGLKALAAIGLVSIHRGDGTYVADPDNITFSEAFLFKMLLSDCSIDELITFREHMEIAVLETAMNHITPEEMTALRENNQRFESCVRTRPDDAQALHQLDIEFHRILGEATGNQLIREVYAVALDLFSPSIRQNYVSGQTRGPDAEKTFLNHQLIYKALERRDVHLASHAVCHSLELWSHWIEQRERELETSHASM